MDECRGLGIGPRLAVVHAARFPNTTSGGTGHEINLALPQINRSPFIHAAVLGREPAVGAFARQQCPRIALVLAAQNVLPRDERILGPVRRVRSKNPRTGIGLAHPRDRHAKKARIVLWLDQRGAAPRVAVVIRRAKPDRGVFVPSLFPAVFAGNRLGAESVNALAPPWDQRDEPVLTVINVKRNRRAFPRFAVVAGAVGDHVVHLPAAGGVMVSLRKHQQQIPLRGAHAACLKETPKPLLRRVQNLAFEDSMAQQTKLLVGNQAARRFGESDVKRGFHPNRKFTDKRAFGIDLMRPTQKPGQRQSCKEKWTNPFHCAETLNSIVPYFKWIQPISPLG